MNMGKKTGDHHLDKLSFKQAECKCGWVREIRETDYGTKAAYDRLLDLYNLHRAHVDL